MPVDGFAVDANLLLHSTPRRLLCGIALETGAQVHILPEVHHEVLRGLGRIERQRVKRRHKDIHGGKRAKRLSAQSAAAEEAATRWYVSELERTDFPLHLTGMGEGDAEEIEKVALVTQTVASQDAKPLRDIIGIYLGSRSRLQLTLLPT